MSELSKIAKGKAKGTTEAVAYTKNSANTDSPMPLPTKSFTCIHINCISRMKIAMKNVAKNNHRKFFSRYMSIFFINYPFRFSLTKMSGNRSAADSNTYV